MKSERIENQPCSKPTASDTRLRPKECCSRKKCKDTERVERKKEPATETASDDCSREPPDCSTETKPSPEGSSGKSAESETETVSRPKKECPETEPIRST